jgi:hypothetical protein
MTGAQEPLTLNDPWGGAVPAVVCARPGIDVVSSTELRSESPRRAKIGPLARHATTSSPL